MTNSSDLIAERTIHRNRLWLGFGIYSALVVLLVFALDGVHPIVVVQ